MFSFVLLSAHHHTRPMWPGCDCSPKDLVPVKCVHEATNTPKPHRRVVRNNGNKCIVRGYIHASQAFVFSPPAYSHFISAPIRSLDVGLFEIDLVIARFSCFSRIPSILLHNLTSPYSSQPRPPSSSRPPTTPYPPPHSANGHIAPRTHE
jgi:hypothetical protein